MVKVQVVGTFLGPLQLAWWWNRCSSSSFTVDPYHIWLSCICLLAWVVLSPHLHQCLALRIPGLCCLPTKQPIVSRRVEKWRSTIRHGVPADGGIRTWLFYVIVIHAQCDINPWFTIASERGTGISLPLSSCGQGFEALSRSKCIVLTHLILKIHTKNIHFFKKKSSGLSGSIIIIHWPELRLLSDTCL